MKPRNPNGKIIITMENNYLISLAEKYGSPLYVYDANKIESQYERLTSAFSGVCGNLKINYATKALSNINVLKLLKNLGFMILSWIFFGKELKAWTI